MGTRVVVMAGGTGGHVYPALAVAEELLARGCVVTWMGTAAGLEARVVPAAGIALDLLEVSGIRGKGWHRRLLGPLMLTQACFQALRILRKRRPQVVLGMGGFVSGPGALMARMLGVPLVVHEQNRIPGTTNRWLARFAQVVLEAFPDSFPHRIGACCTGNPLRRALVSAAGQPRRDPEGPLRLLVFGGSQGAKVLNDTVPRALALGGQAWEVHHQTGESTRDETAELYRRLDVPACVDAFIEDMAAAYSWADVVVCRAGAMTVSELSASGLPAILVPFPHAIDDHQTANARFFADAGAGICLPQAELTPDSLAARLEALRADRDRLKAMARRASELARLDASERVAEVLLREAAS